MSEFIESKAITDAVKWEADQNYCRRTVTVAYGAKLACLQVVGEENSTGKIRAYAPDATNGTQRAAGISLNKTDASAGDIRGVILERDAMVIMDELIWPQGITADQKTAAIAELDALGIKAVVGA